MNRDDGRDFRQPNGNGDGDVRRLPHVNVATEHVTRGDAENGEQEGDHGFSLRTMVGLSLGKGERLNLNTLRICHTD